MTGKELHDLRERKGITKTEAAHLVEVTYKAVFGWEASETIRSDKAYQLAEILESMRDPVRPIITHPPRGKEITLLRKAYGFPRRTNARRLYESSSKITRQALGLNVGRKQARHAPAHRGRVHRAYDHEDHV